LINFISSFTVVLIASAEQIQIVVFNASFRRQCEFVCSSPRLRTSVRRTSIAVSLPRICPPATTRNDAPCQDDQTVCRRLYGRISYVRLATEHFLSRALFRRFLVGSDVPLQTLKLSISNYWRPRHLQ